jgi:hypothetical protein
MSEVSSTVHNDGRPNEGSTRYNARSNEGSTKATAGGGSFHPEDLGLEGDEEEDD